MLCQRSASDVQRVIVSPRQRPCGPGGILIVLRRCRDCVNDDVYSSRGVRKDQIWYGIVRLNQVENMYGLEVLLAILEDN